MVISKAAIKRGTRKEKDISSLVAKLKRSGLFEPFGFHWIGNVTKDPKKKNKKCVIIQTKRQVEINVL